MAFLNSSKAIRSMPYYPWMSKDIYTPSVSVADGMHGRAKCALPGVIKERMMARNTRKPAARRQRPSTRARPQRRLIMLVATRKGAWLYRGDAARKTWRADGPHFLGHVISHAVLDPGRAAERDVWYAGTSPQGLFRSGDGGLTWKPFSSLNDDPQFREWMGTVQDGTPDGPKLHSIIGDPRDSTHLYVAMSGGGVHESVDGGRAWKTLLKGLEVVEGFDASKPSFHDPHCIRICPSNPDRLYQQNHCGIYRLDRPSDTWERIGKSMPERVGDIGFPMVVHPRDADTAWVFPMSGTTVSPPTSPEGMPAVYATRNGGKTWQRLDAGLPAKQEIGRA